MTRVGLTGGIGTGKSLVADIFRALEVPVYHADAEAGKLLNEPHVIKELLQRFGIPVLDEDGRINRKALGDRVFNNPADLGYLNNLIHPLVSEDFNSWAEGYLNHTYIIHEAAILFESGFNRLFDKIILVTAPRETCISRVMKRDNLTQQQVTARMQNQWPQEKKIPMADFIIINDGDTMVLPQVLEIHEKLKRS